MSIRTETWSHDIEFYLVYLGTCVGYGCMWRFPYILHQNGGGVFLIPFFIFLFLVGIPMTYLETSIGQYYRMSITDIYQRPCKKWKGVGIMQVMIMVFTSVYYIMVMIWCFMYFFTAFSNPLPWDIHAPMSDKPDPNSAETP